MHLSEHCNKRFDNRRTQKSLLDARQLGQHLVDTFIKEQLVVTEAGSNSLVSLCAPLPRNNGSTFSTLYHVSKNSKEKDWRRLVKTDSLITAYQAGSDVDLPAILKHELMSVPVSLAEMNDTLRTGNMSVLAEFLTTSINCSEVIDIGDQSSTLIIDGQALVVTVG